MVDGGVREVDRVQVIELKELAYYAEVVWETTGGFSIRELHVLVYILKDHWLLCGDKL